MEAQKNTSGEKGVSIVSFTAAAKIKKPAAHDEMHLFSEKSRQIVSFSAQKSVFSSVRAFQVHDKFKKTNQKENKKRRSKGVF